MKRSRCRQLARTGNPGMQALILSDGKPGHLNQSLAFARYIGLEPVVRQVSFRARWLKLFSYLLDRCGIYTEGLFSRVEVPATCRLVVSAGSETYYAGKTLSRRLRLPRVAIMLPRGYRYDFELIIAQEHDRPPRRKNILALPINLCAVGRQGYFQAQSGERYVALLLGGDSRAGGLSAALLRPLLERITASFPGHRLLVTTSRRTPAEIEGLLDEFDFACKVIYSRSPINPIGDFLAVSDYVFVTDDSTSMLSEAASFGSACVEVLPTGAARVRPKLRRMIAALAQAGCLHVYDGQLGGCRNKISLGDSLREAFHARCPAAA